MRNFERISVARRDLGERNMKTMKLSEFDAFIKGISEFTHICQGIHENKKEMGYLNNFETIKGYLIKKNPITWWFPF